jgi:hypothetical protein
MSISRERDDRLSVPCMKGKYILFILTPREIRLFEASANKHELTDVSIFPLGTMHIRHCPGQLVTFIHFISWKTYFIAKAVAGSAFFGAMNHEFPNIGFLVLLLLISNEDCD